jgi:hypothetical protein
LDYKFQNIRNSLNSKYVITVKALLIFQLELLSQKGAILLNYIKCLLSGVKHFDTVHNSDRRTIIVPVVRNSWCDLWSRVRLTVDLHRKNSSTIVPENAKGGSKTFSEFTSQIYKKFMPTAAQLHVTNIYLSIVWRE